ncbi:MAG: DUF4270 domain-containing protein [Bacteroidetes bacterium]|nr:DUF4270 domain-containing protein [Bacteroidota bacterium]
MNAYRFAKRLVFSLVSLLIVFSCKKDLNLVGLDLISPDELLKLGYVDTVHIDAYSVADDSIKTFDLSAALVGSTNDPVFGRTTANWFGQINLAVEPTNFGTNAVCDSAFLMLPYSGSYGDTMSNMTVHIYPLLEDILDSVHKYSNATIQYDVNNPLGELTFTPRPHDSIYFDGAKNAPYLRIRLNYHFGASIVNADTSDLATNAKFVKLFKGIAMVADPSQGVGTGAILQFAVTSGTSRIDMYYHNATDTSTYKFYINSNCKRFNHFEHENYQGASPILQQQIAGDSLLGDKFLFVQANGGIKVKLRFPYIKNWAKSQKVIINDARLILTNASPSASFPAPSTISIYPIADDGTISTSYLIDDSETYYDFGGSYMASGNYEFRLTRYIQQILTGAGKDNGLFLLIPGSSVQGGRLVLNGTKSPSSPLKLYIKYTVVKDN